MSDSYNPLVSRRRVLRHLAATAGAVIASPLLAEAASASDGKETAAKATKSAVQYQDHPAGASACVSCANFVPGAGTAAMGHCTVVAGDISPHGWCVAYVNNS